MPNKRKLGDYDYHMSYAEIAKELGCSRQHVRTIQENALRKIAHKLREYADYERDCFGEDRVAGRFVGGASDMVVDG